MVMQAGPDGDHIEISVGPWTDPFDAEERQTPENQLWIAKHGKWTAVDATSTSPEGKLIGQEVSAVTYRPVTGQPKEVLIETNVIGISIRAEDDETHVTKG